MRERQREGERDRERERERQRERDRESGGVRQIERREREHSRHQVKAHALQTFVHNSKTGNQAR